MKSETLLNQYLSEGQFIIDDLGRVLITDEKLLDQITGASGISDSLAASLSNGACANAGCM